MKKHKKGFTLVELSIVLVIIGLLIGGILVGQSLIESAKMQAFVRQIQQYDALTATFKGKFGALPGDASVFGCTNAMDTSTNVCNNGVIEPASSPPSMYFAAETALFWKHLSDSGFKPSGVSYVSAIPATNTVTVNVNVPKAQIGTAGIAVYGTAAGGNLYVVGGYRTDFAINTEAGLTSIDSIAFDKKVDDGIPDTGDVRVSLADASPACNSTGGGAAYNIASGSTLVCSLAVRLMANTNF